VKKNLKHPAANAVKRAKSKIPASRAGNTLVVTDGADAVGFIIRDAGSYFAVAPDGRTLIGRYRTQSEAMRSLPRAVGPNVEGAIS
jgi:hypothetical protein